MRRATELAFPRKTTRLCGRESRKETRCTHGTLMSYPSLLWGFWRNILTCTPTFDPEEDSAFDTIENYHEGAEHLQAQGSGAPPHEEEEEEEEEEVEGHRLRSRANRRRGRPNANEEFQANTSAQLGHIFSYMQNMSNTWDNRWAEQNQENTFNRQEWAAQGNWQTAEQDFWEAQRLEDVHQRQQISELQRMAAEAREENQPMSGDISYLIGAFDDLSARFPPPPPQE